MDSFTEANQRSEFKTRIFRIRRRYATSGSPHGEMRVSVTERLFDPTDSEQLASH